MALFMYIYAGLMAFEFILKLYHLYKQFRALFIHNIRHSIKEILGLMTAHHVQQYYVPKIVSVEDAA